MKKLYVLLFFLPALCTAAERMIKIKELSLKVDNLSAQTKDNSELLKQLCKKMQIVFPEILTDSDMVIPEFEDIVSVEAKTDKKPKVSWGKRPVAKEKVVEEKVINKKNEATNEKESIADASDNQGGD